MTDDRYQRSILAKIWRRDLFGGKYEPLEKLMSSIPKERRDKAREAFESLHREGFIIFHKGKKCASINTSRKDEIREKLRETSELPDFLLDMK